MLGAVGDLFSVRGIGSRDPRAPLPIPFLQNALIPNIPDRWAQLHGLNREAARRFAIPVNIDHGRVSLLDMTAEAIAVE